MPAENTVFVSRRAGAPRPGRRLLVPALAFGLALVGCGGGGGSRGGGAAAAGSSTGAPFGSAANQAQWQTAMAALSQAPSPDPVALDPAGLAAFNDAIAQGWPELLPRFQEEIARSIGQALGAGQSGITATVTSLTLDAATAPGFGSTGQAPLQRLDLYAPLPNGTWGIHLGLLVSARVPISIGGFTTTLNVTGSVAADVTGIRVSLPVEFDLSNPVQPVIRSMGTPSVQLSIALSTLDPMLQPVMGLLTQVLDPIVRAALTVGTLAAPLFLPTALQYLPASSGWGHGGPGMAAFTGPAPDLEAVALATAESTDRDHCPQGIDNVYPSEFSDPSGGSLVGYLHHGDSALWTGVYLGVNAYQHDVTGDPRALARATRVLDGIERLASIVPAPYEGLLSRTAIPVSSPHNARIVGKTVYFEGAFQGVTYGGLGNTSRDSYTGVFFGLGRAWHYLPSLRPKVAQVAGRLLQHLEAHGWTVHMAPGQANNPTGDGISVTFVQTPSGILSLATVGAVSDPARWTALRKRYEPVAAVIWLPTWASTREVHEGYYGFNLFHLHLINLLELETDPALYRDYLKALAVMRDVVGHHENPWFDSVYAMAVPPAAPQVMPDAEVGLMHWTRRGRRGFTTRLSQDPSIAKATYTTTTPNQTGSPGQPFQTGARSWEVALYPVPIELRPTTAFLWSSSPFDLDGWAPPTEQHPGIDLLLPWWFGRNHGLVR